MKVSRAQPYYNYAISNLPASSELAEAVAEYLGMRLGKDPMLHPKIWERCIDELVTAMNLKPTATAKKAGSRRLIGLNKSPTVIQDIIYMFQVATVRSWNHVYFTSQQDAEWNNISYYQDPYWQKAKREHQELLEEELYGTDGS